MVRLSPKGATPLISRMRRTRIGLGGLTAGLLLIVAGTPTAAAAGAAVVRSEITAVAQVPCALGGAGGICQPD